METKSYERTFAPYICKYFAVTQSVHYFDSEPYYLRHILA